MNTKWQTSSGIMIGTSLDEIERINKGIFKLTGFGWDYPGRTVSWGNGVLPIQLQLDLRPGTEVSDDKFMQVLGDGYFESSNEVIKSMNLKVKRIFVRWDI